MLEPTIKCHSKGLIDISKLKGKYTDQMEMFPA